MCPSTFFLFLTIYSYFPDGHSPFPPSKPEDHSSMSYREKPVRFQAAFENVFFTYVKTSDFQKKRLDFKDLSEVPSRQEAISHNKSNLYLLIKKSAMQISEFTKGVWNCAFFTIPDAFVLSNAEIHKKYSFLRKSQKSTVFF